VVRIDAHHDMFQCCPALPARERRGKFEFIERLLPLCRNTHAIASMRETSPVRPFTAISLGPSITSVLPRTGLMPTAESPGRRPLTLPGRRLAEIPGWQAGYPEAEAMAAAQSGSSGRKEMPGCRRSATAAMNSINSMDAMPRQRPSPGGCCSSRIGNVQIIQDS